jgi:hypothetical protein
MTKKEFRESFMRAITAAANAVEARVSKPIPSAFLIRLHALGCDNRLISIDDAVEKLYLSSDLFYRIIDVAIEEVRPSECVAFVRPSAHPPAPLSGTWDPSGFGPFKQIIADKVVDRR